MSIFRKDTPVEKAIKSIEALSEQEQAELLSRLEGFNTQKPEEQTQTQAATQQGAQPEVQPTQPQVAPVEPKVEPTQPAQQPTQQAQQAQPTETPNPQVNPQPQANPSQADVINALTQRIAALEEAQKRVPQPAKPDDVGKLNKLAAIYT